MSTNTLKRNKKSVSSRVGNFFVHVFLAMLAAIWVLPIFWIILTSFRAEQGSYVSTFFPKGYTLANYIKLFTDRNVLNFPRMFANTLIIAVFTCIIYVPVKSVKVRLSVSSLPYSPLSSARL